MKLFNRLKEKFEAFNDMITFIQHRIYAKLINKQLSNMIKEKK